jgi:hypothetical protein
MHTIRRHTVRIRRGLCGIATVTIVGLSIVGLTQCRLVDDTVAGPERTQILRGERSACIHRCNEQYHAVQRAEEERHRDALRDCNARPASQRKECRNAEERLHEKNRAAIQRDRKACKRGCYNEGSGAGGR